MDAESFLLHFKAVIFGPKNCNKQNIPSLENCVQSSLFIIPVKTRQRESQIKKGILEIAKISVTILQSIALSRNKRKLSI